MYGGGNPVDAIAKYRDRIWHVHFKDCDAGAGAAGARRRVGLPHGRPPRHLLRARPRHGAVRRRAATRCASSTTPAGSSSNRTCCRASARRPPAHPATANTSVAWGCSQAGLIDRFKSIGYSTQRTPRTQRLSSLGFPLCPSCPLCPVTWRDPQKPRVFSIRWGEFSSSSNYRCPVGSIRNSTQRTPRTQRFKLSTVFLCVLRVLCVP